MGFLGFGSGKKYSAADLAAFAKLAGTTVEAVLEEARTNALGKKEEADELIVSARNAEGEADHVFDEAVAEADQIRQVVYDKTAPERVKSRVLLADAEELNGIVAKFS